MDAATIILTLHAVFWGGMFVLLIYLLIKRLENRDKETFEKRNN
jgi:hypothetical protein